MNISDAVTYHHQGQTFDSAWADGPVAVQLISLRGSQLATVDRALACSTKTARGALLLLSSICV
jgi:hypothetical protein